MTNESEDKVMDDVSSSDTSTENASESAEEAVEQTTDSDDSSNVNNDVEQEDSVGDVLSEEIAALKEQALRAQADAQNTRRRAEQDVEKARKFALEKFVSDLLPVADNLERAIAAGDPEDETQKAVIEGVELTLKSLQDTLKKHKVEMINPAGEPFDPQLHQAMTMVPNPDMEPNTVMDVFQKGYTLNGRLVRPAMVVVSSAP